MTLNPLAVIFVAWAGVLDLVLGDAHPYALLASLSVILIATLRDS